MRTDDFDYNLPRELIAQAPAEPRDSCRLLVLHRDDGSLEFKVFSDILDYLNEGDLLVANETRVMPARLLGHKVQTGGAAEVFLTRRREDLEPHGSIWECLVKPGKRLAPGAVVEFCDGSLPEDSPREVVLQAYIGERLPQQGLRLVTFEPCGGLSLGEAMHLAGRVPLPPYITQYHGDPEKYQTVYARQEEHSAAAPTAGLHFTPELIQKAKDKGIGWETVELEVGIDTFRLVEEDDPLQHKMHTEVYRVPQRVVDAIHATHAAGKRVIAVGTTSVRSLESAWDPNAGENGDIVERINASTSLFLLPGSEFHVVDAMITNFHVPRSTLMMLVSAFASVDQIMNAYQAAIDRRFRMLSFGDAMLIV